MADDIQRMIGDERNAALDRHFPYLIKLLEVGEQNLRELLSGPFVVGELSANSTHVEIAEYFGLSADIMEWLTTAEDDLAEYSGGSPGEVDVPGHPAEAMRILRDLFRWAATIESTPEES